MRTISSALALCLTVACSSSTSATSGAPPLVNTNWAYINSAGTSGVRLTIKSDSTYENLVVQLTSSTSADVQTETGAVVITRTSITFTPKQWSCGEPTYPPYTANYQFKGNSLEIVFATGLVAFMGDTSTATNFSGTVGCFSRRSYQPYGASGGFHPVASRASWLMLRCGRVLLSLDRLLQRHDVHYRERWHLCGYLHA